MNFVVDGQSEETALRSCGSNADDLLLIPNRRCPAAWRDSRQIDDCAALAIDDRLPIHVENWRSRQRVFQTDHIIDQGNSGTRLMRRGQRAINTARDREDIPRDRRHSHSFVINLNDEVRRCVGRELSRVDHADGQVGRLANGGQGRNCGLHVVNRRQIIFRGNREPEFSRTNDIVESGRKIGDSHVTGHRVVTFADDIVDPAVLNGHCDGGFVISQIRNGDRSAFHRMNQQRSGSIHRRGHVIHQRDSGQKLPRSIGINQPLLTAVGWNIRGVSRRDAAQRNGH